MNLSYKQKRLIFVGSTFLISLIALIFIITNFRQNIVFFYSPSELREIIQKNQLPKKPIRIGGIVVKGSIKKINALKFEFIISDLEQEIIVNYQGILPDLFREEQGIVAKGNFDTELDKFFTKELLVKHDENYMPPEVAKSLKKTPYQSKY